jgi:magnesium transporter
MPDSNDDDHRRPSLPSFLGASARGVGRALGRGRGHGQAAEGGEHTAVVDCAIYKNGARQEDPVTLDAAYETSQRLDHGFVWLGLYEPAFDELATIAQQFNLHPLAVEDAVHAHQRPKIEEYDNTLFAVIKTARYVDHIEVVEIGEIMIFLGHNFVITVRHGEATALTDVRKSLEAQPDLLKRGSSAVLWAILDRVVDNYADALIGLSEDIEQIEEAVFDTQIKSPTERIYKLKREVLEFRRAVDTLGDALGPLSHGEHPLVDPQLSKYLRDVHDHVLRDGVRLENYDELLSDVLQANVALASLRQNEDMRKITAWAAILTVITAIAGIYGMNFENMPETRWHYGYYLCLGLIGTFAVGLYLTFRRKNWL